MKKCLTKGVLALVLGGCLASCSQEENFYGSIVENKLQTYEKVFKDEFGTISPDQDWGFGTASIQARARNSAAAVRTRGENANANEWADVTNSTGFGGWLVPDPLTEGQKERVKAYFQANPNLTNQDPHWTNFFVQQVYKGGPSTAGPNSTEVVTAADGSTYTSDNMNLLTVGQNNVHINNFNHGTATTVSVLDNGANLRDHTGETYHDDEIMLMVNIYDTSCFGYHETGSSNERSTVNHNDKWALVAASVIDSWAASHGNPGSAVVDKWNRSFIGFDLAIKEGDQCFMLDESGNVVYADYSQLPEGCTWWDETAQKNYVVAWDGSKVIKVGEVNADWSVTYYSAYQTLAKTNGTKAGWLDTNKNFYVAGTEKTIAGSSQSSLSDESVILKEFTIDGIKYQALINLPAIQGLLDQGYLPVNNKSLKEWVKPGVSDGYFSDWIVTVTEAQSNGNSTPDPDKIPIDNYTETTTQIPVFETTETYKETRLKDSGRVFCEDLGQISRSDLDFNDVVFDAYIYEEVEYEDTYETVNGAEVTNSRKNVSTSEPKYYATVVVLAAGGTLTLQLDNQYEVHNLFEVSTGTLVNTALDENGAYQNPWTTHAPVTIGRIDDIASIGDIDIYVKFSTDALKLEAKAGNAPHKFCVPVNTPWIIERVNISDAYKEFGSYVSMGENFWKGKKDESYLTNIEYTPLPEFIKTTISKSTSDEPKRYIDDETISSGGYQPGEPVLIRKRD